MYIRMYVCHWSSSFFRVYIGLDAGTHFDRALELIALCTFCALCFLCATRLLPAGILPCCLNFVISVCCCSLLSRASVRCVRWLSNTSNQLWTTTPLRHVPMCGLIYVDVLFGIRFVWHSVLSVLCASSHLREITAVQITFFVSMLFFFP